MHTRTFVSVWRNSHNNSIMKNVIDQIAADCPKNVPPVYKHGSSVVAYVVEIILNMVVTE